MCRYYDKRIINLHADKNEVSSAYLAATRVHRESYKDVHKLILNRDEDQFFQVSVANAAHL